MFEGDPGAICPHGFTPEYEPRKRFLTREELCMLLASQTKDHAAQIAFMVATSAEWGAVTRARREDVASDLAFVRVRGTKRKTRDRIVPIVKAAALCCVRFGAGQDETVRACRQEALPWTP